MLASNRINDIIEAALGTRDDLHITSRTYLSSLLEAFVEMVERNRSVTKVNQTIMAIFDEVGYNNEKVIRVVQNINENLPTYTANVFFSIVKEIVPDSIGDRIILPWDILSKISLVGLGPIFPQGWDNIPVTVYIPDMKEVTFGNLQPETFYGMAIVLEFENIEVYGLAFEDFDLAQLHITSYNGEKFVMKIISANGSKEIDYYFNYDDFVSGVINAAEWMYQGAEKIITGFYRIEPRDDGQQDLLPLSIHY